LNNNHEEKTALIKKIDKSLKENPNESMFHEYIKRVEENPNKIRKHRKHMEKLRNPHKSMEEYSINENMDVIYKHMKNKMGKNIEKYKEELKAIENLEEYLTYIENSEVTEEKFNEIKTFIS
jgi:hypothetical protein